MDKNIEGCKLCNLLIVLQLLYYVVTVIFSFCFSRTDNACPQHLPCDTNRFGMH